MSNAVVGTVYEQIIKGVMEASRTDFEDNGFGESEINELQQVRLYRLFLCFFFFQSLLSQFFVTCSILRRSLSSVC